ncbi:TIGR04552 family protein [Geothrix sp. 21YS21S-4]|uniref:TIGR04552 family protein n=1 Tax=Geothrix sp. 21YS21S-4 TaxID=3068889 RepID=UPI0027B9F5AE|nr:TIGR04552 family protein [Geothrix sp. 21YS21S-4]
MRNESLFPMPPEITQVILGGGSPIDLDGLRIQSHDEAWNFALNYGYDMSIPSQWARVVKVYEDAIDFLEGVVLEGTDLHVPHELRTLGDPLDLLVWASERPRTLDGRWSCAVLRVMHTLFHVDHNVNLRYLPEIQRQVFDRYDQYLVCEDGRWCLRGAYDVPLVTVERKENKDRVSMLLKMLHKPENVAETIYDQIGIRLVAEDQLGVLMVIRFLLDHHVLMPTHIKPSRSRNLMIDLEALAAWTEAMPPLFQVYDLSSEERRALSHTLALKPGSQEQNPFSSKDYSAVQFTARTLIRLPGPAAPALESVQKRLESLGRSDLVDLARIPELIQEQEEFTFFFAHEVQVMEQSGFQSSRSGPASHSEYKQRQRDAARRRVLQGILQEEPC